MSVKPHGVPIRLPAASARLRATVVRFRESALGSIAAAADALPDPNTLADGTLVLVEGAVDEPPSLARSVLSVFGRTKTAPRALRCSALVARGYADVGAAIDPETKSDLAWGYARGTRA